MYKPMLVLVFVLVGLARALDAAPQCNQALWKHVYNPDRFEIHKKCMSVTGTVVSLKPEPDGDYHIRVRLDPGQSGLLNDGNHQHQGGNLVVEPVCIRQPTQQDAIVPCQDTDWHPPIPKKGTHVRITGSYVLDKQHGWMELHPVTRFVVIH